MTETISGGLTLTIPSQGEENWATSIKSGAFTPISGHDHTGGGNGLQIGTNAIADVAVTTAKIANGAITSAKLAASLEALPVGMISPFAGSSAPTGWLLCDGTAVSRATYSDLFALISTTYGVGDGATTFNLPNLVQRFPLGKASSGTGATLGSTGGSIDHTHSVPAHYHGMGTGADLNIISSGSHSHSISARPDDGTSTGGFYSTAEQTTQNVESQSTDAASHVHIAGDFAGRIGLVTGGVDGNAAMTSGTNNPPFLAVNFIIKY